MVSQVVSNLSYALNPGECRRGNDVDRMPPADPLLSRNVVPPCRVSSFTDRLGSLRLGIHSFVISRAEAALFSGYIKASPQMRLLVSDGHFNHSKHATPV